jgi:hypothetical protein
MEFSDVQESPEQRTPTRLRNLFTTIGSLSGIAALLWNVGWTLVNAQNSYLQLALEVQPGRAGVATALATIENKGDFSKSIDYAALVISPAQADIREVVRDLRNCNHDTGALNVSAEPISNVLAYIPVPDAPLYCPGNLGIVPLTFFYKEQKIIGNEKLSSRNLIELAAFQHTASLTPFLEVRFVVRGEGRTRSTLDLLAL